MGWPPGKLVAIHDLASKIGLLMLLFRLILYYPVRDASPNPTHYHIAACMWMGLCRELITQNVRSASPFFTYLSLCADVRL